MHIKKREREREREREKKKKKKKKKKTTRTTNTLPYKENIFIHFFLLFIMIRENLITSFFSFLAYLSIMFS